MAQVKFSEDQQRIIESSLYVPPEKEEYDQGDYAALFSTVNIAGASLLRNQYRYQDYETEELRNTPLVYDNVDKYLTEQGYNQSVRNQVLRGDISSWNAVISRAKYVQEVQERERQVQENFSVPGLIAAGLPMAVLDVDVLAYTPVLKAVEAVKSISNVSLATRMAKAVDHGVTGGIVGTTSMLTYEATTGIYHENSLINSFLMGSALGGTLGWLVSKSDVNPNLVEAADAKTGRILSKEESKVKQIESAKEEQRLVEETISEAEAIRKQRGETGAALDRAEKNDRGRERLDRRAWQEKYNKEANAAKTAYENAQAIYKDAVGSIKATAEKIRSLTTNMTKAKRDSVTETKLLDEKAKIARESSPVKGQITKLNRQIEKLKGDRTKAAVESRKVLKEKLAAQQKKMDNIEARIARVDTKLSKLIQQPNAVVKEGMIQLGGLRTKEYEDQVALDKAKTSRDATKKIYSEKAKVAKDYKTQVKKDEEIPTSWETVKLRDKKAQLDYALSGQGLKELLKKRDMLSADIAKMNNDDFNISSLYGIKQTKKNYIDKLSKELEEIQNTKDFSKLAPFKKLPKWAQKLIVSPVEKLLNSDNRIVAGFTTLLHSGTLYHGKINTHNAWNIRLMLDNDLNWAHSRITNNYHEARKAGLFSGSKDEWDDAVGRAVYETTGMMQREMTTGIDGSIVGIERAKKVQELAGTITRKYNSDNQFLNKSVDEILDYYERVHAKGNKLDMPAFRGIGKGYAKRMYSEEKFKDMGEEVVVDILVKAQEAKAIATNSLVDIATRNEWDSIARSTYKSVVEGEYKRQQITKPLGLPKQSTASSLKQRTIDAYDDDLIDLMESNYRGTTTIYGLNTHGRLALKEKLGADTDEQIQKMLDQLGATKSEMDNLRVMIETINGTREISKNPYSPFNRATKMASTFSTAMHTLAFAVPTITEIASISKEFGWGRTIEHLVGKPSEVYRVYRYGTPSEKNSIDMMISYGDAYFATKANRFDVESTFDSVGKVQEVLDGAARRTAVFGGLLPVTDMLRMATVTAGVDWLARLSISKKISKTDEMRLNDMGFGLEDLGRIRDTLQVDGTGRIRNTDRKTWGKLDDDLTMGINTLVERTILHPNGITLPKFMTDMDAGAFLPRIMFKFMRFPVESYERLLVRGIQEADAKQLMALGGNVAMWTAILAMKDAVRDEDKQRYADDEGINQLMIDSLLYNSWTSLPIAGIDTVSGLMTGETFFGDYRYRFGGAVQSDIEKLQQGKMPIRIPFGSVDPLNNPISNGVINSMRTMIGLEELERED